MKRSLRVLVLSCLTAVLLTATAFADMGPKPQLTVKVENAPKGLYYLDLLAEGVSRTSPTLSADAYEREMGRLGIASMELYYDSPTRIGYILQFLSTFMPTILIEGVLLMLFGYGKRKRNWLWFLVVNFITQGGLAWFTAVSTMRYGPLGSAFIIAECVIAVVEGCLYIYLFKDHSNLRAFVYGITANTCSALLGLTLAEPIWRFLVSIS